MDRKLNARLTHKIDTQANWEKATNFIPLKGEWIIYDKDDTHADIRLKIGDGETNVNALPFISTGGTGGGGNSQSVQPDYEQNNAAAADYIKNRPFYEISKEYTFNGTVTSDTITTDTLDLTALLGAHMSMVRLGDPVDDISKLENQTVKATTPDGLLEMTITSEELSESLDGIKGMIVNGLPYLLNVNDANDLNLYLEDPFEAGVDLDFTFPEVGLYSIFAQMVDETGALTGQQVYINKLTLNEIKTIDTKFLPESLQIGYKGTKINWDGSPTSVCFDLTDAFGVKFYKVSEPINTIYDARYSYTTTDLDINSGGYTVDDDYYIQINGAEYSSQFDLWNVKTNDALTVDTTPIGGPGVVQMPFPEPGLYFVWNDVDNFVRGFVSADYGIKPFDEKWIPDTIARKTELDKKADLINGKVPLSQIPDGIGGVQSNWNEEDSSNPAFIKNKPFGEEGLRILWDGIDRGELCIDVSDTLGLKYYKMAEPLSQSELIASKIFVIDDGVINPLTVNYSNIISINSDCFLIMNGYDPYLFVSLRPTTADFSSVVGSTLVLDIEHAGTWFLYGNENNYTCELIGSDYSVKQIDDKFIPQSDWNEMDVNSGLYIKNRTHYQYSKFEDIEWDGLASGLTLGTMADPDSGEVLPYKFYKVADLISGLQPQDFLGTILENYSNGSFTTFEPFEENDIFYNSDIILLGGFGAFVINYDNVTVNLENLVGLNGNQMSDISGTITAPEAGIYFMKINYSQGGYSINGYTSKLNAPKQYVPLNEKYIPDTIMRIPEYGVAELDSSGKIDIDNLPTGDYFSTVSDFYIPTNANVYNHITERLEDLNLSAKADLTNGIVPLAQLPITDTINYNDSTHIPTAQAIYKQGYLPASIFDQPMGIPQLDTSSKIKIAQLPTNSSITNTSTSIPTNQAVYNALQNKANTSDIYTKTEVDTLLSSKVSLEESGTISISQLPINEIIAAVIAAIPNGDEVSY